jgi:hypothetical protein
VLHPPEAARCGAFRDGCHHEHGGENGVDSTAVLAPIQDELPILPKRLEPVFGKLHGGGLRVVTITLEGREWL